MDRITKCQWKFPWDNDRSPTATDLLEKILVLDVDKRITVEEIKVHPFFNCNKIPQNLPLSSLKMAPS